MALSGFPSYDVGLLCAPNVWEICEFHALPDTCTWLHTQSEAVTTEFSVDSKNKQK